MPNKIKAIDMKQLFTTNNTITTQLEICSKSITAEFIPSHFAIAIYVPNLDRNGTYYSTHPFWVRYFTNLLNSLFTGSDRFEVHGTYRNSNGLLLQEITQVVNSDLFEIRDTYTPVQIINIVKKHLTLFAICANQECVKIKVDGRSKLFRITSIH